MHVIRRSAAAVFLALTPSYVFAQAHAAPAGAAAGHAEPPAKAVTAPTDAGAAKPAPDAATADEGDTIVGAAVKWQSLSKNGTISLENGQANYNISLQGFITLPPTTRVLGTSQEATITEALGPDNQPLTDNRTDIVRAFGGNVSRRRSYNMSSGSGQPQIPVYVNLNQIGSRPTKIGSLKGYVVVLVASKAVTKIVDAKAETAFTPVTDNADFKIDQVQLNQNQGMSANVTLTLRKPGNAENPYGSMPEPPSLLKLELVDDQGTATPSQYLNPNMRGNQGAQLTVQYQAQFQSQTQNAFANIKTIRATFATTAAEKKISFDLKDVPLP